MTQEDVHEHQTDIAIVGMAGRFPMARDVEEFWKNLRAGRECISYFSEEELREAGVPEEQLRDPNYVKAWGHLDDIELFDAGFFETTPREAEAMDPQIRMLLECSWEALENAGCDPSRYPGAIGVFAGASINLYLWQNVLTNPKVVESLGDIQTLLVNDKDFIATRVAYKLDLKGPAITVQTACSTSLVATHMGCQSLLSGESDMILAGGVSAPVKDKHGYMYSEGGTFAPDGHVRAFDARAKGMLGGYGVGFIVLKRFEDALADGDTIHAVIKGSALNNDGIDKVSFTAPSVDGQSQVVVDAFEVAGVPPSSVSYVETHGTGTPLGDPIEIRALTQAYRTETDESAWCPIGSVKTNVGHLDIAAGVTGLIKTSLALEHKEIPPSLNYETPNPEIDFASTPFFVNTELRKWDTERLPRRATVSSLGMGGTNSHVILEEGPEPEPTSGSRAHQLLLVSARSKDALDEATRRLADHLRAHPERDLADVAFTLQVGRKGFRQRRYLVCRDHDDALDALATLDRKRSETGAAVPGGLPVAFLFSGQGSQHPNMLRGLYEAEETFRATVDRCCELLQEHLGRDLRELLFPEAGGEEAAAEELKQTRITQPALFVVELALAQLWMEWGVEPDAMVGHSIGEYVAAHLAGVFSLEDALRVVAARGWLIGGLPDGGGMLAVHLSEDELAPLLAGFGGELGIATINAPGLCVVSGPLTGLERLDGALGEKGVSTRKLHTSHAFHSALMDPILDAFAEELGKVQLNAPERPFVSCATGTWIRDEEATDPAYWVRHVRDAVRFADAVQALLQEERALLEVGPGQALTSLAGLCTADRRDAVVIASARHPQDDTDDLAFALHALGKLWAAGVEVEWEGFHERERRRRVPLPTYPFERQRFWLDPGHATPSVSSRPKEDLPLVKDPDLARWFYAPSWRQAPPPPRSTDARPEGCCWLVFADEGGLGDALATRLAADGESVVPVRAGQAFAQEGDGFVLAPGEPDGYARLLEALAGAGKVPDRVAHLWAVDPVAGDALDRAFFSPLFLGQALASAPVDGGVRIGVVTSGKEDVLGDRDVAPEKATAIGPCKSLTFELAGVTCRSVDVDLENASKDELAAALTLELGSSAEDPVVAYQAGRRWTLGYEHALLGEREGAPSRLREGGVYLVTGGLGGIGLVFAELLAETVQAKLVLTARSELPARDAWDAWLQEHENGDATCRGIRAVRRLEELGAEVLCASADVADPAAMKAVVDAALERFGALHGVIHCAGVLGSGVVATKTRAEAERVLAPKVDGLDALTEALRGREPELLVLTSSISSAVGVMAGVDYSAANAYMDAWARRAQADPKTHVVAMCWDTWSEVGMATSVEVPEHLRERHAQSLALAVSPAEGREAFLRVLESGLPQVYVTGLDLCARDDFAASREAEEHATAGTAATEAVEAEDSKPLYARPALSTDYLEPTTETEESICAVWQDLLGIDQVGVDDDFFELGGNSLVMMQLNVRLRSMYGIALPVRELFEMPKVALLAERIESIRAVSAAPEEGEASEEMEEFTL